MIVIQTELCSGGTLEDKLIRGERFTEQQLRDIIFQVASVCCCLLRISIHFVSFRFISFHFIPLTYLSS